MLLQSPLLPLLVQLLLLSSTIAPQDHVPPAAAAAQASAAAANRTVMGWIADIGSDEEYSEVVAWVVANRISFNAVADTTLYSVAANGTVVRNLHNIQRHSVWQQHGIQTTPCIYGDTTLATMRLIWADPEPFISFLLQDAQQFYYQGINLDWEAFGNVTDPTAPPLAADGASYAAFLTRFASAAATAGVRVSATADTPAGECDPDTGRNHGEPCPWYVRLWDWQRLAVSGCGLNVVSTYSECTR